MNTIRSQNGNLVTPIEPKRENCYRLLTTYTSKSHVIANTFSNNNNSNHAMIYLERDNMHFAFNNLDLTKIYVIVEK